ELIAAAHASCFAMALSADLGKAGFTARSLNVKAVVTLEPVDGKPTVSSSALELEAVVPGIEDAKFQELAAAVKTGCPISRLLNTHLPPPAKLSRRRTPPRGGVRVPPAAVRGATGYRPGASGGGGSPSRCGPASPRVHAEPTTRRPCGSSTTTSQDSARGRLNV